MVQGAAQHRGRLVIAKSVAADLDPHVEERCEKHRVSKHAPGLWRFVRAGCPSTTPGSKRSKPGSQDEDKRSGLGFFWPPSPHSA